MAGTMIEVTADGGGVPAYASLPPSGVGPGVVVIQEWWGLVPHIRNVADRLAAQGFVALAPDLYYGKIADEPDEAEKLAMGLRMDQAARDMASAVDHLIGLRETQGETAGAIGFCMGGGLALYLASIKPEVRATVSYYGIPPGSVAWDLSAVRGAAQLHVAEHDESLTPQLAEQVARELRAAGVEVELYDYPGTVHAFFNDDRPETYHREAAERSWQRTLDFLRRHLGGTQ